MRGRSSSMRRKRSSMAPEATAPRRSSPSRIQPLEPPARVVAGVTEPVVQPVGSALPALDLFGREQVAAPVLRSRDVRRREAVARLLDPARERLAIRERTALFARPRAELRVARARGEVRVGVGRRQLGYGTPQTHLPVELAPVERARRAGVRG